MNPLKPWLPLILIVSALLLSAVRSTLQSPVGRSVNVEQSNHSSDAIQSDPNNAPTVIGESDQQKTTGIEQGNDNQKTPTEVKLWPVDVMKDWWDLTLIGFTILFSGLLVVVGVFQVKWLKKQTRVSVLQAKIARRSVQVSRLALQVNRPYLLVTELINFRVQRIQSPFRFIVEAEVVVRNFGTGPADIIDYIVAEDFYNTPPPDPNPNYDAMPVGILNNSLIAATETVCDRLHAVISVNDLEYEDMMRETRRIAIHGRIRYRGTGPEQIYWTRFFWWCFPNGVAINAPTTFFVRARTKSLNDHS